MDAPSPSRVRVDDVELHVAVDGPRAAPTLLFLHGLTDSGAYYRSIVPRFTDRYRTVMLDFRGHGLSSRSRPYATPDLLDDAVTACEQVAGAGCVVVAHSLGGLIGAALAQRRPDLVRGVFLEDPLLIDPGVRSDLLGEDGRVVRDVFTGAEAYLAMIAEWQREGLAVEEAATALASMPGPLGVPYSEAYGPDAISALVEGKLRFDLHILDDFAAARETREAEPVFDAARPIEVPGFVLAGDPTVPAVRTRPIDVERLRATSPSVEHGTVDGGGHFLHLELRSRDRYLETLTGFLSSLDG